MVKEKMKRKQKLYTEKKMANKVIKNQKKERIEEEEEGCNFNCNKVIDLVWISLFITKFAKYYQKLLTPGKTR